uniref:Peptidase M55 n=1 Tax=candidate division WOR-3 bacterium TaxID=2052148 RepID=A0A7V3ZWW9_UNCW3
MRLYISIDMEGIWGLTSWREPKERISELMTQELNLVLSFIEKYAKNADIVIADSHGQGDNLLVSKLPENVSLIRGFPRNYYMMEGLDESFDGVLFIGYHAPVGILPGQMDHSYSSSTFYEVSINGKKVGEAEINGMLAAYYGVPVILISGDDVLVNFSKLFFPDTQFVITKKAISRHSAQMVPYKSLVEQYNRAIKTALDSIKRIKPLELRPPFTIELEVNDTGAAYLISQIPGAVLVSGRKVSYSSSSFLEIYKFLMVSAYIGWVNKNL